MTSKLDFFTLREWQAHKLSSDLPTYAELNVFLQNKCLCLETMEEQTFQGATKRNIKFATKPINKNIQSYHVSSATVASCKYCKQTHYINQCQISWTCLWKPVLGEQNCSIYALIAYEKVTTPSSVILNFVAKRAGKHTIHSCTCLTNNLTMFGDYLRYRLPRLQPHLLHHRLPKNHYKGSS